MSQELTDKLEPRGLRSHITPETRKVYGRSDPGQWLENARGGFEDKSKVVRLSESLGYNAGWEQL